MFFKRLTLTALIAITIGLSGAAAMPTPTDTPAQTTTPVADSMHTVANNAEQKAAKAPGLPTALQHKQLTAWTTNDLVTWLRYEAQQWDERDKAPNTCSTLTACDLILGWFGDAETPETEKTECIQELHHALQHNQQWHCERDAFVALLEATHFISFIAQYGFSETFIPWQLFKKLQTFVIPASPQSSALDGKAPKEAKLLSPRSADKQSPRNNRKSLTIITKYENAITQASPAATTNDSAASAPLSIASAPNTAYDEPSPEDDGEVSEILSTKKRPIRVIAYNVEDL